MTLTFLSRRTLVVAGIAVSSGRLIDDPKNVKLRSDATYMKLAADGKL